MVEKKNCPFCNDSSNVISENMSSFHGEVGYTNMTGSIIGRGGFKSRYYCTKCFVDFEVSTTYTQYNKDKRNKSGNTGRRG